VSLKRELSREDLVEYGCAAASGLAGIWTKIILNLINSQLSHIDGLSEVQQRLASHAMRMSTSSVLVHSFLAHHLFHSPSHLQTRKPTISPFRFHKKKKKTTTSLRTTSTSLLFFLNMMISPLYIFRKSRLRPTIQTKARDPLFGADVCVGIVICSRWMCFRRGRVWGG